MLSGNNHYSILIHQLFYNIFSLHQQHGFHDLCKLMIYIKQKNHFLLLYPDESFLQPETSYSETAKE